MSINKKISLKVIDGGLLGGSGYSGNGGGGDMSDDLERRVAALESDVKAIGVDVHAIKVDLAVLTSNSTYYATKADLQELKSDLQRWTIATLIAGVGVTAAIVFGMARTFPIQPPPIHIEVPQQTAPEPTTK